MKIYKIGWRKFIVLVDIPNNVKELSDKLKQTFPKFKFVVMTEWT